MNLIFPPFQMQIRRYLHGMRLKADLLLISNSLKDARRRRKITTGAKCPERSKRGGKKGKQKKEERP